MTTAELIVRTLDLASKNSIAEEDEGSVQLMFSDKIKEKYSNNKSKGMNFTDASYNARVEVIQEILDMN